MRQSSLYSRKHEEISEGDPKRMERILSRKYTDDDVCHSNIRHYRTWYIKELKKSLRFVDRIDYSLKYESFYQGRTISLSSSVLLAISGVRSMPLLPSLA